ncbi:MAG: DUF434 domain-containing protein [Candidatus Altiarchaeota archaeon]
MADASNLEDAREDIRILLDRGYRKCSALSFISDHYRLDRRQRNRLLREVYSYDEMKSTKAKLKPIEAVKGRELVIDGFNVVITVEAGRSGGEVFPCQDGMMRDNTMAFSNYKVGEGTENAVDAVVQALAKHRPSHITWVFDSQIPKSGRLAEYVRERMTEAGLEGDANTAKNADGTILKLNKTTATSDSALIRKLEGVLDLPAAILQDKSPKRP